MQRFTYILFLTDAKNNIVNAFPVFVGTQADFEKFLGVYKEHIISCHCHSVDKAVIRRFCVGNDSITDRYPHPLMWPIFPRTSPAPLPDNGLRQIIDTLAAGR